MIWNEKGRHFKRKCDFLQKVEAGSQVQVHPSPKVRGGKATTRKMKMSIVAQTSENRNLLLSEFYILRRIIIAAFSWGRWHTSYFLLVIGNANANLAYLFFVAETTETSFVSSRNLCWKNCRFCWGKNSGGKWLFPFLYSEFNYGRCNLSAKVKSDLQLFS